jgi:hypothetical protein
MEDPADQKRYPVVVEFCCWILILTLFYCFREEKLRELFREAGCPFLCVSLDDVVNFASPLAFYPLDDPHIHTRHRLFHTMVELACQVPRMLPTIELLEAVLSPALVAKAHKNFETLKGSNGVGSQPFQPSVPGDPYAYEFARHNANRGLRNCVILWWPLPLMIEVK